MALVICPECKKEISDRCTVCPHCGYPFSPVQSVPNPVALQNVTPHNVQPAQNVQPVSAPAAAAPVSAKIICPKCKSGNVNVQIITNTQLKNKHHGAGWWIFIGWWWLPIKWVFFTIPALIIKIFRPKRQKLKQTTYSMCACQSCGYSWKI